MFSHIFFVHYLLFMTPYPSFPLIVKLKLYLMLGKPNGFLFFLTTSGVAVSSYNLYSFVILRIENFKTPYFCITLILFMYQTQFVHFPQLLLLTQFILSVYIKCHGDGL